MNHIVSDGTLNFTYSLTIHPATGWIANPATGCYSSGCRINIMCINTLQLYIVLSSINPTGAKACMYVYERCVTINTGSRALRARASRKSTAHD